MMELMREKWTDERLDDLSARVDDLGRRMDLRFDAVERRFEGIEKRLDRMLLGLGTTFIGGFVGLASLILAQG
jgi:hypothetical protein